MINFFSLRTVGVDCQQVFLGYPRRGAVFHVFPAVIQTSRVKRIVSPPVPTRSIDNVYALFVGYLLLLRDFLSVFWVGCVAVCSPLVLSCQVFSIVTRRSRRAICVSAWLAPRAYGIALLVVLRAWLFDATVRANLAFKWFRATFHNRDIVARWGDVKQGEFGGR